MNRARGGTERGVTLVELMFAMVILAVVLVGTNVLMLSAMQLSEASREHAIATFDNHAAVGYVQSREFANLFTDVPHGQALPASLYGEGGATTHLPSQQVVVWYTDSSGARYTTLTLPADEPDPCHFEVVTTWQGHGDVGRSQSIAAARTR
jgi:prepilin-type N-terminal cleavage/methylation domain-containing protein